MNRTIMALVVISTVVSMPFAFAEITPLMQFGTGPFPVIEQYKQNSDGTWEFTLTIPDGKKAYGNLNDGSQKYYGNNNIRLYSVDGTESFTLDEDFPKENYNGEQCVFLQIFYKGAFGYSMQYIC